VRFGAIVDATPQLAGHFSCSGSGGRKRSDDKEVRQGNFLELGREESSGHLGRVGNPWRVLATWVVMISMILTL
jgi:hypothetical protein